MTDNEIIKAYEKCIDLTRGCCGDDVSCPYCTDEEEGSAKCFQRIRKDVVALLNRQKAEIESLKIELQAMRGAANSYKAEVERLKDAFRKRIGKEVEETYSHLLEEIKAEAIKEFVEKFKDKKFDEFRGLVDGLYGYDLSRELNRLAVFNLFNTCANDILEEMTEQRKDDKSDR